MEYGLARSCLFLEIQWCNICKPVRIYDGDIPEMCVIDVCMAPLEEVGDRSADHLQSKYRCQHT